MIATLKLDDGAIVLGGFALDVAGELVAAIRRIETRAPFRNMVTPGGFTMSVAMTNCGTAGWVTDRTGYRYDDTDPESGKPWPPMPDVFAALAVRAATAAGYPRYAPDSCLINRYVPGTQLSLHQDKNERDFEAPIVSVSLGLPATFLWGGAKRAGRPRRVKLENGDVVVWGGSTRLHFHGVARLRDGVHPLTGSARINLTFRKAL